MKYTFRPLRWDGPRRKDIERYSRYWFKATWSETITLLERELHMLRAEQIVIEADFREQDLRIDGLPRQNARRPSFPGVRLAFDSLHGPLIYATDAFTLWEHNVRAIALTLESLRRVDRYGVTGSGEQYTGWRQIEAAADGELSVDEARELLDFYGGYAHAVKVTHPDRPGGNRDAFERVQRARKVLEVNSE